MFHVEQFWEWCPIWEWRSTWNISTDAQIGTWPIMETVPGISLFPRQILICFPPLRAFSLASDAAAQDP